MNSAEANSLHRLATLQRLAAQQEDHAARQLADALAKHANAGDRHAELLQYEIEYASRVPATNGVMALTHHAGFLAKLRDAVHFQHERVGHLATEVERARLRWIALHREVEKLEQLGDAARRQIAVGESRRESRDLDELATRSWVRQQAVGW
ncbi:MAG: flagellar export protein FliJ [Stagnimonas sp.]|nr:flagellar export protein FliJ [Stagnimonas sp.]